MPSSTRRFLVCLAIAALSVAARMSGRSAQTPAGPPASPVSFIDTGFENASPLWYETAPDGSVQIYLLYDHERDSPNRAAGHIHFRIHARTGAKVTLEFRNLDNVYNGQPGSVAGELKTVVTSQDGRVWTSRPTESLPGNRVRLTLEMPGPSLYVARVEPYRLSDLDALLAKVKKSPLAEVTVIGRTVGGRPIEIIRIGDESAPHRFFVRARAHPWEAGSNWVVQGMIESLLDRAERGVQQHYAVYILPMANKDGVARGMTRFNLNGKDLNRDWDKPARPDLAPENAALERWLERMIAANRKPDLAIEFHNDGNGRLHISRPRPENARHDQLMVIFEGLLRKNTWFTEGTTAGTGSTLANGWLERYGIHAVVHELNCNWIAGVNDYPSARYWKQYGQQVIEPIRAFFTFLQPGIQ